MATDRGRATRAASSPTLRLLHPSLPPSPSTRGCSSHRASTISGVSAAGFPKRQLMGGTEETSYRSIFSAIGPHPSPPFCYVPRTSQARQEGEGGATKRRRQPFRKEMLEVEEAEWRVGEEETAGEAPVAPNTGAFLRCSSSPYPCGAYIVRYILAIVGQKW